MIKLPKNLSTFTEWFKKNPKRGYGLISLVTIIGFWLLPSGDDQPKAPPQKLQKPLIEGVEQAVDPRAIWSDNLTKQMAEMTEAVKTAVSNQNDANHETITSLKDEIASLRYQINQRKEVETEPTPRIIKNTSPPISTTSNFVHLHQNFTHKDKKDIEDYVTSGSFARSVLLTGVVAETGTDAAGTPQPILLRLVDFGIFSKGYLTPQIKEAIIIGSCYGNISSERAICRLETLSLVNNQGDIVERPVEGWLIGEDGRPGIKGEVVDKASDVARMAVLNGILGGMAGFLQNQASAGIYPISPIAGQSKALTGIDSLKSGASSGVGNALQKLADYAIKRAEQMSPVIVVGAGRVIDVVFRKGFQLKDVTPINNTPIKAVTSVSSQSQTVPEGDNHPKPSREGGYNQGVNALNNLQMGQQVM